MHSNSTNAQTSLQLLALPSSQKKGGFVSTPGPSFFRPLLLLDNVQQPLQLMVSAPAPSSFMSQNISACCGELYRIPVMTMHTRCPLHVSSARSLDSNVGLHGVSSPGFPRSLTKWWEAWKQHGLPRQFPRTDKGKSWGKAIWMMCANSNVLGARFFGSSWRMSWNWDSIDL